MLIKKLVIENRDGTIFKTLKEFQFSQLKVNDVNTITVFEDPAEYFEKFIKIYSGSLLISSGIFLNYTYDQVNKQAELEIYPLIYDMRNKFITDDNGNRYIHYNDYLENILQDAITRYRGVTPNPLISIGDLNSTGIKLSYTFENKLYLEVVNELIKYLDKNSFIRFNLDGSIDSGTAGIEKRLVYGKNITDIKFKKSADEIINFVVFDNKLEGDDHILSEYKAEGLVDENKYKSYYWPDSRVTIQETADTLVTSFLSKNKDPKITIENIESTDLDIKLYDKIRLDNWDKKFTDDLFCVGLTYTNKDTVVIEIDYKIINRSQFQTSTAEVLDIATKHTSARVPEYIQGTYIDSTNIKSPTISGNDGLFSGIVKVGTDGIIIDGENKLIKSNNFAEGSTGWQIDADGNVEFNNGTFRGNFVAGSININNNFAVDADGNVRGNNIVNKSIKFEDIGEPSTDDGQMRCGIPDGGVGKTLLAYMGGQSEKQQISMTGMKLTGSFEHNSSTNILISTRFMPRNIFFFGRFMNITTKKYGITIGQASFNENGRCSSIQLGFQEITYIDSLTATTASVIDNVNLNFEKVMNSINIDFGSGSYSYTTKDACTSRSYTTKSVVDSLNYTNKTKEVVDRVDVAGIDKLGTDSVDNNAYIEATNWTDLGLTISSTVGPGWIIGGNYIVQG